MNICYCGSELGYPHASDCPYPYYGHDDGEARKWGQARDAKLAIATLRAENAKLREAYEASTEVIELIATRLTNLTNLLHAGMLDAVTCYDYRQETMSVLRKANEIIARAALIKVNEGG